MKAIKEYEEWVFTIKQLLALPAISDQDNNRFGVWFKQKLTPKEVVDRYMPLVRGPR